VREFRLLLGLAINLQQLAAHKHLPVDFLQGLGLIDLELGNVGIPYRDGSGKTVEVKQRARLSGNTGSRWPKGKPLLVYGEDRLEEAGRSGYLILVEGESDCWTLWFHGEPGLGIPGVEAVAKTLQQGHVAGCPFPNGPWARRAF
jgi:putative DNA primase/helicase